MAVIVDTGPLYALIDRDDRYHAQSVKFFENEPEALIVPALVLAEVSYLALKHAGEKAEIAFVRSVVDGELQTEPITPEDLARSLEILEKYQDNRFGLVDASVMACAERLNVRRVATLDRRHFSAFVPKHCDAFEIWPAPEG